MTLPTSGTITARMINVELGRAEGAAFSITGSAERALAGKPTGAISFSDFYGKSNGRPISWTGNRPASVTMSGASSIAVTVQANGNVTYNYISGQGGSGGSLGSWTVPQNFANDGVQVRIVASGSATSSQNNVWVALNTASSSVSGSVSNQQSGSLTISFRRNGGSVLESFVVNLDSRS